MRELRMTDQIAPAGSLDAVGSALPASLDLSAAVDLRDACLAAMSAEGDVTLDVSPVEAVATPCIQVLLAMSKGLENDDRRLRIVGESEAMARAFDDLGLGEFYRNWSEQ
jgi:anti-anti-sigma regulatory factor